MINIAELIGFLRARTDEDYETAYGAAESPWRVGQWSNVQPAGVVPGGYRAEILDRLGFRIAQTYHGGTTGHVERFDPTRMLAEVQAKRAILDLYTAEDPHPDAYWIGAIQAALLQLATPYADHPDYREEWRP